MLPTLLAAFAHHLLAFLLAGLLATELALTRNGMTVTDRKRLGRVDALYGLVALGLLGLGFWRASAFEKGMEFYAASPWFWIKVGAFLLVGALSVPPTLAFRAWGKRGEVLPLPREIAAVRRWLWAEVACLALVPVAAALMARGY